MANNLLTLVRDKYTQLGLEPIDTFMATLDTMNNIEELRELKVALEKKEQRFSALAMLVDTSFGQFTTQEANVTAEWYANYYSDNTLNIDFGTSGGKWKSVWETTQVLAAVRELENALTTGEFPNRVRIGEGYTYIGLGKLTTDEPELYLSELFDASIFGVEPVATFIVGLMLDLRVALASARLNRAYKNNN